MKEEKKRKIKKKREIKKEEKSKKKKALKTFQDNAETEMFAAQKN